MAKKKKRYGRLPGDLSKKDLIARIIRVDQAGEYGAKRIYDGQLAILSGTKDEKTIREMAEAEKVHLRKFDELMSKRRVRPTLLSPLWHIAGFALGAATASMGREAAMACTVAVEEVIESHYADQIDSLADEDEQELVELLSMFRDEELNHMDTALQNDAENARGYSMISTFVKSGSRIAIWLSERI